MKILLLSIISVSLATNSPSGTRAPSRSHVGTLVAANPSQDQSVSVGLSANADGVQVLAADLLSHMDMTELPEPQAGWLRQIITDFTPELRSRFLRFTTDLFEVPAGGFDEIGTISIRSTAPVQVDGRVALPRSHICFRTLHMPLYESIEQMQEILTNVLLYSIDFGDM